MDSYTKVKKINLGLTNKCYLTDDNKIIRLSNKKVDKLLDRENEIKVIELIKNNDITIKILDYGYDKQNKFFVVTNYFFFAYSLENKEINPEKIINISKLVKKFHEIDTTASGIKVFNYKLWLQKYKKLVKKPLIDLTLYETRMYDIFQGYKPRILKLCHNDLVEGNLLFNEDKMYLIDFEYACINDPLFDIASFISETLKKDADIALWIKQFNLSKEDITILNNWIYYQDILWIYWANYMYEINKNEKYLKIIEHKYHNLKNR